MADKKLNSSYNVSGDKDEPEYREKKQSMDC